MTFIPYSECDRRLRETDCLLVGSLQVDWFNTPKQKSAYWPVTVNIAAGSQNAYHAPGTLRPSHPRRAVP
jgi:hypothetical protein